MITKETAALLLNILLQVKLQASEDDIVKKAVDISKAKEELVAILKGEAKT